MAHPSEVMEKELQAMPPKEFHDMDLRFVSEEDTNM